MLIPFTRSRKLARVGTAAVVLFLIKGLAWLAIAAVALWG
jgi:hypothetical protein